MIAPDMLGSASMPARSPAPLAVDEFETLLESVLDVAYRTAYHFTRDPADAEDLVQEAALLACRHRSRFERGTNFRAWFLRILTNAFYSKQRRRPHGKDMVSLDEEPCARLFELARSNGLTDDPDPATTFVNRLDAEQISRALEALPLEFRVVTTMYLVDDLPYRDIASVLGIPVGTVRSRLHRGRALLKQALWHVAMDGGLH